MTSSAAFFACSNEKEAADLAGKARVKIGIDQEISEKGIQATQEIKPAAFYNKKTAELITPLNYNDHLSRISECDWVIEAISERLDWKKDLYSKILEHLSRSYEQQSCVKKRPIFFLVNNNF